MGCTSSKTRERLLEEDSYTWPSSSVGVHSASKSEPPSTPESVYPPHAQILLLPQELLLHIVEFVGPRRTSDSASGTDGPAEITSWLQRDYSQTKQLLNIALSCRAFSGPALAVLWRSARLTELLGILHDEQASDQHAAVCDGSSSNLWAEYSNRGGTRIRRLTQPLKFYVRRTKAGGGSERMRGMCARSVSGVYQTTSLLTLCARSWSTKFRPHCSLL